MWPSTSVSANWLICDGTAINRSTYSTLYSTISTAFGVGDGSITFNLPDMRKMYTVGYDSGVPDYNAINDKGGLSTVTLTVNQIPPHTHGFEQVVGSQFCASGGAEFSDDNNLTQTFTTGSTGGNQPHNNLPPYLTLMYIIKAL